MDLIRAFLDFVLHLDQHLVEMVNSYGTLTYAILFGIIFSETGLVIMPFLPGDSLLFAAGAVASKGGLNIWGLMGLLMIAAFTGNAVNYFIGRSIGPVIFERDKIRFIRKEYLVKTQAFYEKYGAQAVILSRFLPIFRTFVPFVAGIGNMNKQKFMLYNALGAFLWVLPFCLAGYYFAEVPFVKKNFSLVIVAILVVTALPALITGLKEYLAHRKAQNASK